ncbi:18101_t:CDS:2 [Entrophospora sp. SA101]|nr:9484_t:CDS:2 [Entrophospora sp. SA101]CAJ0764660.1 18101_t:CDS:2 [Entrophospora sp. SA101]CAJ0830000.1 16880_t:CDS:2 [Entrophospora sp. SA101]CAJ0855059.1 2787_t:CDS:2 [Entrophospora sp. SA101]
MAMVLKAVNIVFIVRCLWTRHPSAFIVHTSGGSIREIFGILRAQVEKTKRHIMDTVDTKTYGESLHPSIDSSMMISHL